MKRYVVELGAALALYAALLVVSVLLLRTGAGAGSLALPDAILPMLAGPLLASAILRQIGRADELQRRMQLEAIGLSFLATALLSITYGFLENAGFPRVSMFAVWPVMAAGWVLALVAVSLRYRR